MHLTGQYPKGWTGRRFDHPTRWWAGSVSNEMTRDNPQRILLGEAPDWGSGTIPRACLTHAPAMKSGFPSLVDTVRVKHVSGGTSLLRFKAYEQGREKWQGETLDGCWMDEEPPADIYGEAVTRTHVKNGLILLTCTPLLGMTEVIGLYYPQPSGEGASVRAIVQMTIDDALHFNAQQRADMLATYQPHEREARAQGIPMLGSGLIYPVEESRLRCPVFKIPRHWPSLGGMDFGSDHPFAAVKIWLDRDSERVYLSHEHRERGGTPVTHAAALKAWGKELRWSWPHDGNRAYGDCGPLADQYRQQGLKMLPSHATFEHGGYGVDAGITLALSMMETGRLLVFETCVGWFSERRLYHRKDGKIQKQNDDLMDATRVALMSLRHARVEMDQRPRVPRRVDMDYDPLEPAPDLYTRMD